MPLRALHLSSDADVRNSRFYLRVPLGIRGARRERRWF